jgi:hypothetical protein
MNPYPAHRMTPVSRRAELCAILALGLRRLKPRDARQIAENHGESSLHFPPEQSVCHRANDGETHDHA